MLRSRSRLLTAALSAVAAAVAGLAPLATAPATAVPVACSWPITLAYDGLNVLAPDTQASYWLLHYEVVPGTSLRIEGTYPRSRFFSHTIQDVAEVTLGAVVDQDIRPVPGDRNPFLSKRRVTDPQHYAVHVEFTEPPASGAEPNTLYAGRTYEDEPNPSGTIVYRVYVPDDQTDPQGGVPLPKVVWETPSGDLDLTFEACQPLLGGLDGPANGATEHADRPAGLPFLLPESSEYSARPEFKRLQSGYFTDPVVKQLPPEVGGVVPHRGGTPLANAPFPYLASSLSRKYGETLVIRMKLPSFPDTVAGEPVAGRHQSRYFSLCSYAALEEAGLRGSGCLTDFQLTPDGRGRVTIVVSDPAHRPSVAAHDHQGVAWLPWGPYQKAYLLYRIGLPRHGWKHSPLRIGTQTADQVRRSKRVMGAYYPVARYCPKAQIESRGLDSCF